jgi:GNAT superfamily N-acetyltransferase
MSAHELRHEGYLVTDDRTLLDHETIHRYLSNDSYWAKGVSREIVDRSLENSLCLGVYGPDGKQAGLARIITDCATFAYLCDVFILDAHRGKGLGKALMQAVITHPHIQTVRRITLATDDAHGLYAAFGFQTVAQPEKHMEKRFPANYPPGVVRRC